MLFRSDNAKALARKQEELGNRELSGERANHHKESESHNPNVSAIVMRECKGLALLTTKREMRALRDNPTMLHFVLICKGEVLETNDFTNLPPMLLSLLQEYEDVFPDELPPGLPPLRGIEHRIDLIPGAPLPNRAPVTPRDRALCRFQHFRQNPHNNQFQIVIYDNITTVLEYSATTTEKIHTRRLNESRIQIGRAHV